MGVKLLNTFLKSKIPSSSSRIHWSKYDRKKIAIDTNNYIYKFMSEQKLEASFIRMCDMFKYYNIIPLFVFDGKAPEKKYEELKCRKKDRKVFEKIYTEKKELLTESEKIEMRRKMVKVTKNETQIVKNILDLYGFNYIKSPEEADVLCCKLVVKKKVCACLSEDMDLFSYGCPHVLRLYSNTNYIYKYDLNNILYQMKMDLETFKYLTILANLKNNPKDKNIFYFYKIYLSYCKQNNVQSFVDYLQNYYYIDNNQYNNLLNVIQQLDIDNNNTSHCNLFIRNKKINKCDLIEFKRKMRTDLHFCPT